MMIRTKRIYEPIAPGDGRRYLVERLWPRGLRKSAVQIDRWLKELAPSTELRRWFAHDPDRWQEFQRKYAVELDRCPAAWRPVVDESRHHTITLLYSARDTEHNNAEALRAYLEAKRKA